MSVTSVGFLLFTLLIVGLYYLVPGRFKPYIILTGSLLFYLSFTIEYLYFILFTVTTTFISAQKIEKAGDSGTKKKWLISTITVNAGILLTVKYLPYYLGLIENVFSTDSISLSLLVPIGISFYTLQMIGYLVDVYRGNSKAEKNYIKYLSFATFFPLILQGPISRYNQLGHQLFKKTNPDNIYLSLTYGSQLIVWGLFKKLVIADRAAILVNAVFNDHTNYTAWPILVASLFYTIQIYADFSGFVDISRGIGQMFGIDIIQNFRQPYFATSIADFWRRWHIALSSWLRDYVYIPLGGNRKGIRRKYINILLVFFISGVWHGVGLQFIAWGLLHGIYQITGAVTSPMKNKVCNYLRIDQASVSYDLFQRLVTFGLIVISWIVFRSENLIASLRMTKRLFFDWEGTQLSSIMELGLDQYDFIILFIAVSIVLVEWMLKERSITIRDMIANQHLALRWTVYSTAIIAILIFGIYGPGFSDSSFIYMNF